MNQPFSFIVAMTVMLAVSSSSSVQDTSSEFSCCDRTVSYSHDLSCDNMWSADETTIATISYTGSSCASPCKEIKQDRMILDRCVNVTLATACFATGTIKERQVTHRGQMCHLPFTNGKPTGNQSSVGLLQLAVMIGFLLHFVS